MSIHSHQACTFTRVPSASSVTHWAGNRAPSSTTPSNQLLQAKLRVGSQNDPLEREADDTAERVLAGGHAGLLHAVAPAPQRMCAECPEEQEVIQRQVDEEEDEELQLKVDAGGPGPAGAEAAAGAVSSGGEPLSPALRSYFEPRFGHEFSAIRIHTGAPAAASARAVHALAYTLGRDIVFGAGQYAPASASGRKLLAHELTHAVQQSGGLGSDGCLPSVPALQRQPEPLEPPGPPGPLPPFECKVDIFKHELECCARLPTVGRVCAPDPRTLKKKIEEALKKLGKTPPVLPPTRSNCPGRETPFGFCCHEGEVWKRGRCEPISRPPLLGCSDVVCAEDEYFTGLPGMCCKPKKRPVTPPVSPPPVTPPTTLPSAKEIFFNFDRPSPGTSGVGTLDRDLTSKGRSNLDKLVKQLKGEPTLKVQLVGKASPEGGKKYNLDLGRRRAEMIARALEDKGIDRTRIADPPVSNLSAECQKIDAGLHTCGEEGATGEEDRQVMARVFKGQ